MCSWAGPYLITVAVVVVLPQNLVMAAFTQITSNREAIRLFPDLGEFVKNDTSFDLKQLVLYLSDTQLGFKDTTWFLFTDAYFEKEHFVALMELIPILNQHGITTTEIVEIIGYQIPFWYAYQEELDRHIAGNLSVDPDEVEPYTFSTVDSPDLLNIQEQLKIENNKTVADFWHDMNNNRYMNVSEVFRIRYFEPWFRWHELRTLRNQTRMTYTELYSLLAEMREGNLTMHDTYRIFSNLPVEPHFVIESFWRNTSKTELYENCYILTRYPDWVDVSELNKITQTFDYSTSMELVRLSNSSTFDYSIVFKMLEKEENLTIADVFLMLSQGIALTKVEELRELRRDVPITDIVQALRQGIPFDDFFELLTWILFTTTPAPNTTAVTEEPVTGITEPTATEKPDPYFKYGVAGICILFFFMATIGSVGVAKRLLQSNMWKMFLDEYFPEPQLCLSCRQYDCEAILQQRIRQQSQKPWRHPIARMKQKRADMTARRNSNLKSMLAMYQGSEDDCIPKISFAAFPSLAQVDNGMLLLNYKRNQVCPVIPEAKEPKAVVGASQALVASGLSMF